jgi:hypothetical protein
MALHLIIESYPCEHCGRKDSDFSTNITRNVIPMAREAGIYSLLWEMQPEELALELIHPLITAIQRMTTDEQRFRLLEPRNGWGSYSSFLKWLKELLEVCQARPTDKIYTS